MHTVAEQDIRIDYFEGIGRPVASLIPAAGQFYSIGKYQMDAAAGQKAFTISCDLIKAKLKNQLALIKYYSKNKKIAGQNKTDTEFFGKQVARSIELIRELKFDDKNEWRNKLMGFEGAAGAAYWQCIKTLIPAEYNFERREHHGSQDLVNMMFNYAYGVLYTKMHSAVTISGLHPNISFLHAEQKGKPTLVYDLVEPFRAPIADRTIVTILNLKMKVASEGGALNKETKSIILRRVLDRFHTEFTHHEKRTSFSEIFPENLKMLLKYLTGEGGKYKPYLSKW